MTFQRFKTEVYYGDKGIDPLLVWACIRSLVKGSIEATTQTDYHVVDRKPVLNLEVFGNRRCRLSVDEQRPTVHDIFEKYQQYMQECNLWDDCDRIMEGQMKLLCTAVTRSIERLFFVETEGSVAGDAFVRWITTTSMAGNKDQKGSVSQSSTSTPLVPLASRNKVGNVESITMTRDEWLSSGMDNAEAAEVEEDLLLAAESLWDKAIYCFREAQDHELARKARAHRSRVRFQMKLPVLTGGDEKEQVVNEDTESEHRLLEVEGADIVESLLCEGLTEEAKMSTIDSVHVR